MSAQTKYRVLRLTDFETEDAEAADETPSLPEQPKTPPKRRALRLSDFEEFDDANN